MEEDRNRDDPTASEVSFGELFGRADDELLQELVGKHAVRLLNLLDRNLAKPTALRKICLELHSAELLLRDPEARGRLITLLRPTEARALAKGLQIGGSDPYQALAEARFTKRSERERALFSFLDLTQPPVEHRPPPASIQECVGKYSLFDHQRGALGRVREFLLSDRPRVVLHMPTGSGKTRTALHVVAETLRREEPTVVVWLAYSEELCGQAADEFSEAWSRLGDRTVSCYRLWGSHPEVPIDEIGDGFVVAGLAKTYERAKRDGDFLARLADRTSLVIIDEAHQAIAETYRFLLDYLVERHKRTGLLGLTATPGRTWDDPEKDEALAEFFCRQKASLEVAGYETPIDYLTSEGYLAKPRFRSLTYEPAQPIPPDQLKILAESLEIPESVLRHLAEDDQRNLLIVSAVENLAQRHLRVLVFAATVEHARLIATVLRARGVEADCVTAATPSSDRNRIIARYKNNEPIPRVLCNYGVLTTGFDAPSTSAAVIARPTKSLVLFSQMVGRATRGPRVGGNEEAEILTVTDTELPGFRDMSEAFRNWEDVW